MKRNILFFILLLAISLNCFGKKNKYQNSYDIIDYNDDFQDYLNDFQSNTNSIADKHSPNSWTIKSTSSGDYISGPDNYYAVGHQSGDTYYINEW